MTNNMTIARAWTKTIPRSGAPVYTFDAAPIGVYYVTQVRDNSGRGRLLGYGVTLNFYETGKARAGSQWNWALLPNTYSLRAAFRVAAASFDALSTVPDAVCPSSDECRQCPRSK